MNTSKQYQTAVLEALCDFVRDQTKKETNDPPITEVQAALTVIGRREVAQDLNNLSLLEYFAGKVPVDLHGAHIPFAALTHAKLSVAILIDADLNGAVLANADLSHANLTSATLIAAYMIGANLNTAVLKGTDLRGARLDNSNLAAVLIGTDLRGTDLSGANLSGASLDGATKLSGANLSGADLRQVHVLTQSQLDDACGDENTTLDPPLTIKPCLPDQPAAGSK